MKKKVLRILSIFLFFIGISSTIYADVVNPVIIREGSQNPSLESIESFFVDIIFGLYYIIIILLIINVCVLIYKSIKKSEVKFEPLIIASIVVSLIESILLIICGVIFLVNSAFSRIVVINMILAVIVIFLNIYSILLLKKHKNNKALLLTTIGLFMWISLLIPLADKPIVIRQ